MKALINIILIGIIFCFLGCSNKTGHEGPTGYEGEKLDGKYHGQGTMTWSKLESKGCKSAINHHSE